MILEDIELDLGEVKDRPVLFCLELDHPVDVRDFVGQRTSQNVHRRHRHHGQRCTCQRYVGGVQKLVSSVDPVAGLWAPLHG